MQILGNLDKERAAKAAAEAVVAAAAAEAAAPADADFLDRADGDQVRGDQVRVTSCMIVCAFSC